MTSPESPSSEASPERPGGDAPKGERLFVAIELPHELKSSLVRLQEDLAGGLRFTKCRLSWVSVETMHLTLRFLGSTPCEQIDSIGHDLEAACAKLAPVRLKAGELGVFPSWKRPRVLWSEVRATVGNLADVQRAVESVAIKCGFKPEPHSFRPHLTLARFQGARGASEAKKVVLAQRQFEPPKIEVSEIVLFKSDLGPGGAKHTVIRRVALRGVSEPLQ